MKIDTVFGFETDTVWGMGCNILSEVGVNKIYETKGRDRKKPLILMSNNLDNLLKYVQNIPDEAMSAVKTHFPGALTVILEKSPLCPPYITNNATVAIRIPNHKGFFKLCETVKGGVLATTSLNFSDEKPCANYDEAIKKFGKICKIIKPDNNICPQNIASTVVNFAKNPPEILRQGSVEVKID